jgi:flagellin-like hook-associated protein FlgL
MRVTEAQIFSLLTNNLQRAQARFLKIQEQISTGKRVMRPADDPSAFNAIVFDKTKLAQIEQRLRNIQVATTRLDLTDKVFGSATNALARAQELAVRLRSDTNGIPERSAGAVEVRQLLYEVQQLANTELRGEAIFAGTGAHGRATGVEIAVPVTLSDGTNDTLQVTVDGVDSGIIKLVGAGSPDRSFTSGAELAAELQSKINADAALAAAGKSVTVTFEAGRLVIASNGYGEASTVRVVAGSGLGALGFNGGSTTSGAVPFALTATTRPAGSNSGQALIAQGRVSDPSRATFDNYVIRFRTATAFDVYSVSAPVVVSPDGANTGGAGVTDAGVVDPTAVTLDTYEIRFTSADRFDIVDTTTGSTVSTANSYRSGDAIDFEGLRVVLSDGLRGAPQSGDRFAVTLSARAVLTNQTYTSGGEVSFEGLRVAIADGASGPATGDRFSVVTGVQYQGNDGIQQIEIGSGQTLQSNVPGNRAFSGPTVDVFAAVGRLYGALNGNWRGGISQALADLEKALTQIASVQGETGALAKRLEATAARLDETKGFITEALSQHEDVDLVKAISDLTLQQYALEAAGRTLTKIFDSTLLKFLR